MSQREIAQILKVSCSFICRLLQRHKKTGSLIPTKPISTRPRKVDYEKVRRMINENPNKTLKELGQILGNMGYVMKKIGYTYKKTLLVRGEKGRFGRRLQTNT